MDVTRTAFAANVSLSGQSKSSFHIDFILLHPSVFLDRRCILRDGECQIDLEGSGGE